jgi:hypothetical protein
MSSDPLPDWRDFEVEETGAAGGYCECCATTTKNVWGFVYRNGEPVGAYFESQSILRRQFLSRGPSAICRDWSLGLGQCDVFLSLLDEFKQWIRQVPCHLKIF